MQFADSSFQVVFIQTQLASLGGGGVNVTIVQFTLLTDIVQQVVSRSTSETLQSVGGHSHCSVVILAVGNHWETLEVVTGQ